MTDQDPTRLADQSAVDSQLKDALSALAREGEGAERLARVAGKLGALLDAPPPALPLATRAWHLALRQLTASKLTVALLVVGGSLWLALQEGPRGKSAEPVVPPVISSQPRVTAPADVLPTPAEAAPEVRAEVVAPHGSDVAASPVAQPTRRMVREARPTKRLEPSVLVERAEQLSTSPAAGAAQEGVVSRSLPAPEQSAVPQLPRARSEAELLFEARKALAERPRQALALLEQHAQLYAHGQLAPEREVLAIEALRKLGNSEAAAARARRFRAEYPDSFHLKGLE